MMEFLIDDYLDGIRTTIASAAELHQLSRSIPRSAEDGASYALSNWQFVRAESRTPGFASPEIVLIGVRLDTGEVRITTPVVAIDPDSDLVVTESEARYQLVGHRLVGSREQLMIVAMHYARPLIDLEQFALWVLKN